MLGLAILELFGVTQHSRGDVACLQAGHLKTGRTHREAVSAPDT